MASPSEAAIERALREHRGNVSRATRAVGYKQRKTLYARINASPFLQEVLEETREELVDEAEWWLYEKAAAGDLTANLAILNNHPTARKRGWGKNQTEITGANGGPLRVEVEFVDADPERE